MIKRTFDVIFSVLLLSLLMPAFLAVSVLIYLEDGRPIIFKQKRAGRGGREFILYKFRTMKRGIEKKDRSMVRDGKTDYRITKLGKFLRSNNLDEIPQLINILRGEMSFVGPRPDPSYEFEELCRKFPEWKKRTEVSPGLTGLAQLNGARNINPKQVLKYDLYYVKNWSFLLDLRIFLRTPGFSIGNTFL